MRVANRRRIQEPVTQEGVSFDRAEVEPNISTEAESACGSGMKLGPNLVYAAMQMNPPKYPRE